MNKMNRAKQVLLGLCVLGAVAGTGLPAEAQEVPTCSPANPCEILWTPNTEPDVVEYRVLLSRTSGGYDVTRPAATIAHPTAEGSTTSVGTLQDGRYFVAVVAVDHAGNVSGLSNEAVFEFDGPPGAPAITIRATIP